jgi:hypothetical protein
MTIKKDWSQPMEARQIPAITPPRRIAVAGFTSVEMWRIADRVAKTEQERAVLIDSFVYALPPRAILARHPDLFADVGAVYAAKRDLFRRLERHRKSRRQCQESQA